MRYAVDRVQTTGTVFLGLTLGCCVCHDHKFDPITQKEFYRLFGYFGSLTEKPMDGNVLLPPPAIRVGPAAESGQIDRLQKDVDRRRVGDPDRTQTFPVPGAGQPMPASRLRHPERWRRRRSNTG